MPTNQHLSHRLDGSGAPTRGAPTNLACVRDRFARVGVGLLPTLGLSELA